MPNTYAPMGSKGMSNGDLLTRIVSGHSPMICADILRVNTTYQFMIGAHKFTLTTLGNGAEVTMTLAHWGHDDKITNTSTRRTTVDNFSNGFMSIEVERFLTSMLTEIAVFVSMEEVA